MLSGNLQRCTRSGTRPSGDLARVILVEAQCEALRSRCSESRRKGGPIRRRRFRGKPRPGPGPEPEPDPPRHPSAIMHAAAAARRKSRVGRTSVCAYSPHTFRCPPSSCLGETSLRSFEGPRAFVCHFATHQTFNPISALECRPFKSAGSCAGIDTVQSSSASSTSAIGEYLGTPR